MKIQWKQLLIAVAIPLAVGGLAAFLTRENMQTFESLNQPPLAPPMWLFPVVWTILYTLMGVASYLVYRSGKPHQTVRTALGLYAAQLVVNFFWSLIFFNLQAYWFAFFWLVLLWVLIFLTWVAFRNISKWAGRLLVPYLAWVTFAGYLNAAIAILN